MAFLHRQFHDGTHNVTLSLFESLDSLASSDAGLSHNKLYILRLNPTLVYITFLLFLLNNA